MTKPYWFGPGVAWTARRTPEQNKKDLDAAVKYLRECPTRMNVSASLLEGMIKKPRVSSRIWNNAKRIVNGGSLPVRKKAEKPLTWKHRPGFVYLIREPKGHYKIGRTKDVADRMRTFEVKLPYPIEILHTIKCEDMYATERFLHNTFAAKRVNGEWFSLADEEVAYIMNLHDVSALQPAEDFGY